MKKITNVLLKNFKQHQELNLSLERPTVLIGNNGSGKSSIIQAVTYAALGYIPDVDKKVQVLKDFVKNGEENLSVTLNIDDGVKEIVKRSLNKTKTSFKEDVFASFSDNKTISEKNSDIIKKLNIQKAFFDISSFMELNQNEKSELIYNLVNSDIDDGYMERFLNKKGLNKKICEEVLSLYDSSLSLTENVDMFDKYYSNIKKETSNELKELEKTSLQLSAINNNVDYSTFKDLSKDIEKMREELSALQVEINGYKKNNQQRSILESKLAAVKGSVRDLLEREKKLIARKETVEKELSSVLSDSNNSSSEELLQRLDKLDKDLSAFQQNLREIEVEGVKASSQVKNREDLIKKIQDTLKTHTCVINPKIPCANAQNFKKAVNDMEHFFKTENSSYLNLRKKYKEVLEQQKKLQKNKDILSEELSANSKKVAETNKKIASLQKELKEINAELAQIALKKQKPTSIKQSLALLPAKQDTIAYEKIANAKKSQIQELVQKQNDYVKYREHMITIEQTEKSRKSKEEKLNNIKSIIKALKDLKIDLIKVGIKPFVDDMNKVLNLIQYKFKAFIEVEKSKSIFGFTDGDKKYRFQALSTGESLIFLLALAAAVYKVQPDETLRVFFMDNLDSLDDENLKKLLSNISKLKDTYFDNIILAGVIPYEKIKNYDVEIVNFNDINNITTVVTAKELKDSKPSHKRYKGEIKMLKNLDYQNAQDDLGLFSMFNNAYLAEEAEKIYRSDLLLKKVTKKAV